MTDKFVVSTNEIGEIIVTDLETGNVYHYGSMSNFLGLIRLLNEQDEKIKELEKENDPLRMITGKELFKEIDNLKEDIQQLEKENREAHHSKILANAFIIEKGLTKEFIKWSKEND